jgi:transposase
MEWVAFVGVDWADQKHAYAVRGADGSEPQGEFSSRPEEVHSWVARLRERYPTGTIMIALEQSRGPLLYALSGYDFIQLVPVNPRALKAFRTSLRLSGAKDDPTDAVLIRDFAATHLSEMRVWSPDDAITRKLRLLVESRRLFVDQRTAFTQALKDALKQYYPQIIEWFKTVDSPVALAFVKHWPTLESARTARTDVLRRVIKSNSRRTSEAIDELITRIRGAIALTSDQVIIQATALRVASLCALVKETDAQVRTFDQAVAQLWAQHADRELFASFPGAGAVMAPRLAAAFGSERARFTDAVQMQNYAGISPVTEQSGKHSWVHSRFQCPKFLRQTFHEFAEVSIPHSDWAHAFYRMQRERGAGHHQAIRSLAFRWIRILYRAWSTNIPYDESRYVDTLRRKNSPLATRLAA